MPQFIADFHIHSKYSLATSKKLVPEWLDYWARVKGIKIVGTGDCTHPEWLSILEQQLEKADKGTYTLKHKYKQTENWVEDSSPRFILTTEISTIYKKAGKTRKVHTVFFFPDFDTARTVQNRLEKRNFNIRSDGRPIIGLDARDLVEMCMDVSEDIICMPAHIWTPWFSALGAKSGFDSIEECYGDMAHHISAIETGLSSDVPMNFMCRFLDSYALLSNSDAHSPDKLGRNANIFDCNPDYYSIKQALEDKNGKTFVGTIDMYPQEGKYHYSGHRKCNECLNPLEVLHHNFMCPTCNKPLTLGVMDRVTQLSDRDDIHECSSRQKTQYAIPLTEILSELLGVGPNTKKVSQEYKTIIRSCTNEMHLLTNMDSNEIAQQTYPLLAEGIRRMREGDVFISPGYDGKFGSVHVFSEKEKNMFKENRAYVPEKISSHNHSRFDFDLHEYHTIAKSINFSDISNTKSDSQLKLF
ncbi:MAG: endonuclease Q family protein [Bacteroidales bacterium]